MKNLTLGRGGVGVRCVVEIGMAGDIGGADEGHAFVARDVGGAMFGDLEDRRLV